MLREAGDWLDERTGWRGLVGHLLDEPVLGGARWAYVFGSVLLFLLVLQGVTGVLLASFYAPSTTTAWASVAYLNDQVTAGWLVRGLHSMGASAMVIVLGLHLGQTALWGAYKKPREMNWIFGVLLLMLTSGFALTGYLLPWDQKGYWATQVATSLLGAMPLVGHALLTLLQGGDAYGNLTITHFFALHVFVLPSLVVAATGIHVALMRRHGVTPRWGRSEDVLKADTETFWPSQALRDVVAITVVFAVMLLLVLRSHGADLEAPADPTAAYDARPEWYFLPLFELLKFFPGRMEIPAAIGGPSLFFGLLLALPFIDKGSERNPRTRLRVLGALAGLLAGAVGLGVYANHQDAVSKPYQAQRDKARADAERARTLARKGMPPAGGVAVYENDPAEAARRLFGVRCAGCHLLDGAGEHKAPVLDGWASRGYARAFLAGPDDARFFGNTKIHAMKPVEAAPDELDALAEYAVGLGGAPTDGPKRARGESLFKDKACDVCHEVDGTSEASGNVNLGGWGSVGWLKDFLRDPGGPRFFGKHNEMPRFGEKLSETELEAMARFLVGRRDAAAATAAPVPPTK